MPRYSSLLNKGSSAPISTRKLPLRCLRQYLTVNFPETLEKWRGQSCFHGKRKATIRKVFVMLSSNVLIQNLKDFDSWHSKMLFEARSAQSRIACQITNQDLYSWFSFSQFSTTSIKTLWKHSTKIFHIYLLNFVMKNWRKTYTHMDYEEDYWTFTKSPGLLRNLLDWQDALSQNWQCMSSGFEIKSRVPQGSVLGPLLFIMYTSEVPY